MEVVAIKDFSYSIAKFSYQIYLSNKRLAKYELFEWLKDWFQS